MVRLPLLGVLAFLALMLPERAAAYSVLTHMAIVDAVWLDGMQPVLKKRFPTATEEQLRKAHAHAYGGCLIHDLGYYPMGSRFFTELTHYVRSADFVEALVAEAQDINELAFALGAVSHYHADVQGHSIAVNRSVPVLFPALRTKFGDQIAFAESPSAHLKTEFGIDVLQVARGRYAPGAYHSFIGFEVSKDLLDRAFYRTYGLHLNDIFGKLDLSLGTFRYSVCSLLPSMTRLAWALKHDEIVNRQPGVSRRQFLYNIRRSSYEKEWGQSYKKPGFWTRFGAFFLRLVPRVGPFRGFAFKVPTTQTERWFEDSFNATVAHDKESFGQISAGRFRLPNLDLDTGRPVRRGDYALLDKAYGKLVEKLSARKFDGVSRELRTNIVQFYESAESAGADVEALRQFDPGKADPR